MDVLTDLECLCRKTNTGIKQQHAYYVQNTDLQVRLCENGLFWVMLNGEGVHVR